LRKVVVDLNIPADEYVAMYKGIAKYVVAVSRDGRTVRFPANCLQKFVTRQGIYGTFSIYFDNNNKLVDVTKN
jgi:hypothetical protein